MENWKTHRKPTTRYLCGLAWVAFCAFGDIYHNENLQVHTLLQKLVVEKERG